MGGGGLEPKHPARTVLQGSAASPSARVDTAWLVGVIRRTPVSSSDLRR